MNIDMKSAGAAFAGQFQNLAGRPPGMWPVLPRVLCACAVTAAVVALGYFGYWNTQFEAQDRGAADELKLKEEYTKKVAKAINLEALQKQRVQIDRYVVLLEKQLPSKADIDSLLSDINRAGSGRGLQFDLFKPGQVVVRDYYAELPIDLKVSGSYHDIGAFAGDMANLPRIVTLNNMSLTSLPNGTLSLEAVAKTFRYLDPEEAAEQRKAKDAAKKDKRAKGDAK